MFRLTEIVKILLIVNILFFIGTLFVGDISYQLFAMYFPMNENFKLWQLITHMFMHDSSSIWHIMMNMLILVFFGPILEDSLGKNKFIFLYFSAGIGATLFTLIFQYVNFYPAYSAFIEIGFTKSDIIEFLNSGQYDTRVLDLVSKSSVENMFRTYHVGSVGASGATYGLTAAFAALYPNKLIYFMFFPMGVKAKYLIGFYFLMNIISALSEGYITPRSNIGHLAHIGGAIIGFIMMYYWKKNSFNDKRWY